MTTAAEKIALMDERKAAVVAAVQRMGVASHEQIASELRIESRKIRRAIDRVSREGLICWIYWRQRRAWVMPETRERYTAENTAWATEQRKALARAASARARALRPKKSRQAVSDLHAEICARNRNAILSAVLASPDGIAKSVLQERLKLGHTAMGRHLRRLKAQGLIACTSASGAAALWGPPSIAGKAQGKPARKSPGRPRKHRTELAPREQDCLSIIRASSGISKADLAERMGVGVATVASWCARLRSLDLIHSTAPRGGNRDSLWRDGAESAGCEVRVPAYMARQVPSVWALGALG